MALLINRSVFPSFIRQTFLLHTTWKYAMYSVFAYGIPSSSVKWNFQVILCRCYPGYLRYHLNYHHSRSYYHLRHPASSSASTPARPATSPHQRFPHSAVPGLSSGHNVAARVNDRKRTATFRLIRLLLSQPDIVPEPLFPARRLSSAPVSLHLGLFIPFTGLIWSPVVVCSVFPSDIFRSLPTTSVSSFPTCSRRSCVTSCLRSFLPSPCHRDPPSPDGHSPIVLRWSCATVTVRSCPDAFSFPPSSSVGVPQWCSGYYRWSPRRSTFTSVVRLFSTSVSMFFCAWI